MIATKPAEQVNRLADQLAQSTDAAVNAAPRAARKAIDNAVESAEGVRGDAVPMLNRAADRANALTQRGLDAVRDTSRQLRDRAERASDSTVKYVRDEPFKALLLAGAAGAALMAIIGLVGRARSRGGPPAPPQ